MIYKKSPKHNAAVLAFVVAKAVADIRIAFDYKKLNQKKRI